MAIKPEADQAAVALAVVVFTERKTRARRQTSDTEELRDPARTRMSRGNGRRSRSRLFLYHAPERCIRTDYADLAWRRCTNHHHDLGRNLHTADWCGRNAHRIPVHDAGRTLIAFQAASPQTDLERHFMLDWREAFDQQVSFAASAPA